MPEFDEEQIAKVCHDANRSYSESIGDYSLGSWEVAPNWQRDTVLSGVRSHLATLKAGNIPSPAESHAGWLKIKTEEGWVYGPEKNSQTKRHPCMLPYAELSTAQKTKDYIFVAIVKAFFEAARDGQKKD